MKISGKLHVRKSKRKSKMSKFKQVFQKLVVSPLDGSGSAQLFGFT